MVDHVVRSRSISYSPLFLLSKKGPAKGLWGLRGPQRPTHDLHTTEKRRRNDRQTTTNRRLTVADRSSFVDRIEGVALVVAQSILARRRPTQTFWQATFSIAAP